jgi:Domain of unknown function (DUF4209)
MPLHDLTPKLEDFANTPWEMVIQQIENGTCDDYYSHFLKEMRRAAEEGNRSSEAVFALLAALTSFHPNLEKHEQPFGPLMVMGGSRSAIPDDLTPAHLETLEQLLPSVKNDDLRARIADVLWVQIRPRKFQFAQDAVAAYLETFRRLADPEPVQAVERLERAFQLAASLGKKNESFNKVTAEADQALKTLDPEDSSYLPRRILELFEKFSAGDAGSLAKSAATRAVKAEADKDWETARSFWELKVRWDRKLGEGEAEIASLDAIANTLEQEAEAILGSSDQNYFFAGEILQQTVEAYRRAPGRAAEERRIHLRLLEVQKQSRAQLQTLTKEVDISEMTERSREVVRGKSLREALLLLPFVATLPNYERLRQSVIQKIQKHPVLFLFSALHLDEEGRVSSRRPSMLSDDPKEREAVILAEIYQDMRWHRELSVAGQIEPVRTQILLDHNPRLEDIAGLLRHTPFVPEDRILLLSRGIYDGLIGDFLSASHILVPQVENSIRYVLHQAGAVTSTLTSEGTQEGYDLNRFLYLPKAKEVFGVDVVYDMRGLLVEKVGSNLRNGMLHGLLSDGRFFTSDVVYLWWLVVRLCLLPRALHEHEAKKESQPAEGEGDTVKVGEGSESQSS